MCIQIVGSVDAHPCRYVSIVRLQYPVPVASSGDDDATEHSRGVAQRRQVQPVREQIDDIAAVMRDLLIRFYRTTKFKPARIIYYRGGVSEGQFDTV